MDVHCLVKNLSHEYVGKELKITAAHWEKNCLGLKLNLRIQSQTLFLGGGCNLRSELDGMNEMDTPTTMRIIKSKLPNKLRERWRIAAREGSKTNAEQCSVILILSLNVIANITKIREEAKGNIQYLLQQLRFPTI